FLLPGGFLVRALGVCTVLGVRAVRRVRRVRRVLVRCARVSIGQVDVDLHLVLGGLLILVVIGLHTEGGEHVQRRCCLLLRLRGAAAGPLRRGGVLRGGLHRVPRDLHRLGALLVFTVLLVLATLLVLGLLRTRSALGHCGTGGP